MQRALLGLIAASLLVVGGLLWWFASPDSTPYAMVGPMVRMGTVFAALWVALPNVRIISARVPAWLIAATLIGLLAMAWRPRTILLLGPVLVVLWAIGPNWLSRRK